jgi:hypothetical protein
MPFEDKKCEHTREYVLSEPLWYKDALTYRSNRRALTSTFWLTRIGLRVFAALVFSVDVVGRERRVWPAFLMAHKPVSNR